MCWEDKNALITGISGFAGSYLAKYLVEQGANVFGLAKRRADGSIPKNLIDKGIVDSITLIEGDLFDRYIGHSFCSGQI